MAVAQPAPEFHRVDVLPCGGADTATAGSVFGRLEQCRRPVLLDCPAGAGPDVAVPLRAAERAVVVSTPHEQSLRDAAKTASMARQLNTDVAAVFLTRSDGHVDPGPLFACDRVVHIPTVSGSPLEAEVAKERYRRCASIV
jgi:septum site-determining protein MinD